MERLKAILMLEILGKPKEHVKESLIKIVENLGKEKDVKINSKDVAEPKKLEQEKTKDEVFTSFAEIELETSLDMLMLLIFGYMPSHIEILEPENLKIRNSDLNLFFNELAKKLHQYDEIARTLMIERQIIAKQLEKAVQEGKIKVEVVGKKLEKVKKKKKN